jgi:hypothetical protein
MRLRLADTGDAGCDPCSFGDRIAIEPEPTLGVFCYEREPPANTARLPLPELSRDPLCSREESLGSTTVGS